MILCCGEALIDMIPHRTATGQAAFVPYPGGAVFNTAIALGRLGVRTGMVTGLSTDMFGQQLASALSASHVSIDHVIVADRTSTLAFVTLVDGHASYAFFDENSAGRTIGIDELPTLSDDVNALFFGGISLAVEPAAETYAHLLAKAGRNRAIMMDPNIRPSLISDTLRYRERLSRLLSMTDIIKVSDEDLNWIYPGPESLNAKVALLRQTGPSLVILTRGGEGATAFLDDDATVSVAAPRVTVVDTVGAGDTFNAGLLASLSEQGVLTKQGMTALTRGQISIALEQAAKVAAVTVSRAGANPPWRDEVRWNDKDELRASE